MSRASSALDEAKAYLRSAKSSLDAGDEGPCISNLFYVLEHLANILKDARNGQATRSHDEKQRVLRRAYSEGSITSAELKACNRIYNLRVMAQQHPYTGVKGRTPWNPGEVEKLYEVVGGLLKKTEERLSG
ncbi:MAG: hypothetical protein V1748_11295 [Actinomycetota bacterium]